MDRYLQLADLAASQWGMVTAAQARHLGGSAQQSARLNRNGMLQRLQHGVYRLAGVPHDPLADLRAAWLSLDPEITAADRLARPDPIGVVSHRSAARVHQLGDLDADINEFTVTAPKRTRHPDARIYKRDLTGDDWEVIGGLPTTRSATPTWPHFSGPTLTSTEHPSAMAAPSPERFSPTCVTYQMRCWLA